MSVLRDALRKAERAQEEARQEAGTPPLTLALPAAFEPQILDADFESSVGAGLSTEESSSSNRLATDAAATANEPRQTPPRLEPVAPKEAKSAWEPNPRLPFHLAVVALGAVAVGIAVYFWNQLRPQASAIQSAASLASSGVPAVSPKPAATEPLLATTEQALASLPTSVSLPSPIASDPGGNAVLVETRPSVTPATESSPIPIPRALADPAETAEALPDIDPGAAHYFSQGNQHARNGRWTDARKAFARALAGDPDNPDLAFNFAVSLDRLHQSREALAQYEHALRLREGHDAAFPVDAARERARHLARPSARR